MLPCRRRLAHLLGVMGLFLAGAPAVSAHDTTPKPIVSLTIAPRGTAVNVNANVPIVALTDVNWPRQSDGTLIRSALAEPLALVARDFAARLELSEGENGLPMPVSRATLGADAASVDIVLEYVMPSRHDPLSARLRAWPARPEPVPTVARFVAASGAARVFEVDGAAERIVFEPERGGVAWQFVTRAVRALQRAPAGWLFALCLGLTAGAARLRATVASWLAAQLVVAAAAGAGEFLVGTSPAVPAVAASAVAVTALVGIVAPGTRWLSPLAAIFGVAQGLILGASFTQLKVYAGDHQSLALLVVLGVTAAGYAWMVALVGAVRALAGGWGMPERWLGAAVSLFVLHTALHLVDDETTRVDAGDPGIRSLVVLLVAVWVVAAIVAGFVSSRRQATSATRIQA